MPISARLPAISSPIWTANLAFVDSRRAVGQLGIRCRSRQASCRVLLKLG